MWELKWGSKEDFLEELEEQGKNPPALEKKPILNESYSFYIDSFNILSSRRPVGEIECAIPISEMVAYLCIYPWYDSDLFIRFMIVLDKAYLEFRNFNNGKKTIDFRSGNRPGESQKGL